MTHFSAQRFQLLRQLGQPLGRCLSLQPPMTYLSLGLAATLALQSQMPGAIAQTTELPPLQSLPQTPATPITETVLYVNPVLGMDSNSNGSVNAPLKTLTYALEIARPNTTIQLAPGLYSVDSGEVFPISLKPNVTITGQPKTFGQTIILRGGGNFRSPNLPPQNVTILAGANQAIVEGLTILNPNPDGYAIQVEASSPTLRYNTLTGNGSAIALTGNSESQIQNNLIINNQRQGIAIFGGARPVIDKNVFEQTGLAIVVDGTAAPVIQNNRLTKNLSGIVVQGTAQPKIYTNTIENNAEYGVLAQGQSRPELGEAAQKNAILNNGKADTSLSLAGLQAPKERPPAIAQATQPPSAETPPTPATPPTTAAANDNTPSTVTKDTPPPVIASTPPPQATPTAPKSTPAIAAPRPPKEAPTEPPATGQSNTTSASDFLRGIKPEAVSESSPETTPDKAPSVDQPLPSAKREPQTRPDQATTAVPRPAPIAPTPTAQTNTTAPATPPAIAFGQTLSAPARPEASEQAAAPTPTAPSPAPPAIVVPVEPVPVPAQLPNSTDDRGNLAAAANPPLANLETPAIATPEITQANFPVPSALNDASTAPIRPSNSPAPKPAIKQATAKAPGANPGQPAIAPSTAFKPKQTPVSAPRPTPNQPPNTSLTAASFPVPNPTAPPLATPKPIIQPAPQAYRDRPVAPKPPVPAPQTIQRAANPLPILIPVPPPDNRNQDGLPNLMPLPSQSALIQPENRPIPAPTQSRPPNALLPVPNSDIPVGNIGDMPKVYTSNGNSAFAQTSSVTNGGTANAVKYRVVVQVQTEMQKTQLKTLFPTAFSSQFQGRSVLQVGAFSDRSKAEQLTQILTSQGFAAAQEGLR